MTASTPLPNRDQAASPAALPVSAPLSIPMWIPKCPALARNVQLVGELQGTGFQDRQWLIQRGGQFIQLTELLYRVAEQINGERTLEEIATAVTESTDWLVTADNVGQLLQAKLMPLGLIARADGSAPAAARVQPDALGMNIRMKAIGPRVLDPVTGVFQWLYAPPVVIPILIAVAALHIWLYAFHGLMGALSQVLYTPGLLFIVLGFALAAAVFHEFGHASALRYSGGRARSMGFGLYLIYPVLYTDATDSYRLGRAARVRTDLGGVYFHLVSTLVIFGLYLGSGASFILLTIALIDAEIIRQFIPFIRLDGYWLVADLAGVPDFFSQIGPFLRTVLPLPASKGSRMPELKPRVRRVFALYLLITIPLLAALYVLMIVNLPGFLVTTWDAILHNARVLSIAMQMGNLFASGLLITQMLLLALPIVGTAYFTYLVARPPLQLAWTWGRRVPARRLAAGLGGVAVLSAAVFFAVPKLTYLIPSEPAGTQHFTITERDHVQTPVEYAQIPPVAGNHSPVWQNCGFYDAPIHNENGVDSLEHGAVWITYRPGLPADQVDRLRQLAHSEPYIIVSPYPNLPAPVVLSAWNRQLRLDSAGDPRLDQFVRAFRLSAQAPDRGGPCIGGTGVPQ